MTALSFFIGIFRRTVFEISGHQVDGIQKNRYNDGENDAGHQHVFGARRMAERKIKRTGIHAKKQNHTGNSQNPSSFFQ